MPRKPSTAPKRRTASRAAHADTPRMLSEAEKHELIRLHAARRAPQDPLQRMSVWAGVTLCVSLLLVGWWFTVGVGIRQAVTSDRSNELRALTEELDRFTEEVNENPLLNPPTIVPQATASASAAEFQGRMEENLGLNATRTQELLVPKDENEAAMTEPTPNIPPGLTPDETP